MILKKLGAEVSGYSLAPPTKPSLFEISNVAIGMNSVIGDIRDFDALYKAFTEARPEIVIHMAAQPLVRESYKNPVGTYASNVMGTVNILECVRTNDSVVSFINVTTDKVYLNREREEGYKEDEELNGYDPYSNSKSCSELVTSSYKNSFFGGDEHVRNNGKRIAITTMRAGNVIGGGDFANDRIIPDCIRAAQEKKDIIVSGNTLFGFKISGTKDSSPSINLTDIFAIFSYIEALYFANSSGSHSREYLSKDLTILPVQVIYAANYPIERLTFANFSHANIVCVENNK